MTVAVVSSREPMPSLRQLSARHESMLVLDAASSRVQVGWLRRDAQPRWQQSDQEAGIAVFRLIEALKVDLAQTDAFLYCDGPGSILGIRTVAMALRTWAILRPLSVYAYSSLAVVAHAIGRFDVNVIADARHDSWHHYRLGGTLRRVTAPELAGVLVMPENFRHWSPLPAAVQTVPYALAEQLPRILDADLFIRTENPDAFLHEEPSYATWTPQIHRAPSRP